MELPMRDFEVALEEDVPRGLPGFAGKIVDSEYLDVRELAKPEWSYRSKVDPNIVSGIILGYRQNGDRDVAVGVADDRHVMTIAGSRTGKGVSLLVPNLLRYDGSVVVIDPKGDLARITARARRQKGQKVVVLDPFNENGRHPGGSFNPLDELDPNSRSIVLEAGGIADAMVTHNERDPHWTNNARILLRALILLTMTLKPEQRNLVTVRQLLMLSHPLIEKAKFAFDTKSEQAALFALLTGCVYEDAEGTGRSFSTMSEKERESILSTARTETDFLADERMHPTLTSSSLKLSELKTGKTTVYLCLPATRMNTHSKWLRIIVNLAVNTMEQVKQKPDIPVLFLLDEFHVLGHMKSIETAAGLMAGFGVKLWVVLQDLSQIKSTYQETWETFVGNAGVLTAWGNSDNTTLHYLSERLGQTNVQMRQPTGATPGQKLQGASSTREEMRVQAMLGGNEAAELLDRETGRILVSRAGRKPIILKRIIYYRDDEPFEGEFDSHELTAQEIAAREQEEARLQAARVEVLRQRQQRMKTGG
jgi:type IV secretion system protein VirD4